MSSSESSPRCARPSTPRRQAAIREDHAGDLDAGRRRSRRWERLRRWTYRRSDRIVVQSEGAAAYFRARFGDRVVVIPNPVPSSEGPGLAPSERLILGVRRLTEQKAFDLLLRSFGLVQDRSPGSTITILA